MISGQVKIDPHLWFGKTSFGLGVFLDERKDTYARTGLSISPCDQRARTGVCSTRKLDLLRSIGADHVIDYTQEDFTQKEQRYDLIFAAGGNRSIFDYKRALTPEGIYVCVGGSMKQYFQAMLLGPLISMVGSKKMGTVFAPPTHEDYNFLIELFEAGKLTPVIDRQYPLSELAEALQYYGEGHAMGKVVITVEHE